MVDPVISWRLGHPYYTDSLYLQNVMFIPFDKVTSLLLSSGEVSGSGSVSGNL